MIEGFCIYSLFHIISPIDAVSLVFALFSPFAFGLELPFLSDCILFHLYLFLSGCILFHLL